MTDLKSLLKNNHVSFAYYRKGYLYYTIPEVGEFLGPVISDGFGHHTEHRAVVATYMFPVPLEDIGDATFNATEKAILFMRYIRKAQEEGSFVKYHG